MALRNRKRPVGPRSFSAAVYPSQNIQMVNLKSGVVAYAVASYRVNALNGNKSTTEHLAKSLRQKMERDEKRLRK